MSLETPGNENSDRINEIKAKIEFVDRMLANIVTCQQQFKRHALEVEERAAQLARDVSQPEVSPPEQEVIQKKRESLDLQMNSFQELLRGSTDQLNTLSEFKKTLHDRLMELEREGGQKKGDRTL